MIGKAASFIKGLFNKKDSRQETVANFHTTIIRVDDNYISSSSIVLDEVLVGNIYSLKEVQVTGGAEISGNVMSRTTSVSGRVDGDIIALDFADIKASAVIKGNIRAKAISIESGAMINGAIRIEGDIDDRDLIRKVETRIPSHILPEPVLKTYALPDATTSVIPKEPEPIKETKENPKESSKKTVFRKVRGEGEQPEPEKKPTTEPVTTPNSWY